MRPMSYEKKKKKRKKLEIGKLDLNVFFFFFFSYYKLQLVANLMWKKLEIEGKLLMHDKWK